MIDQTFREGYIQGFKAVHGDNAVVGVVPQPPEERQFKYTPFQLGIIMGIRMAGGLPLI